MPHPVDIHVGARLRALRAARGVSQTKLGDKLGITFQQVQKYETGTNRISASKLYDISRILNVQPNYFFEGLDNGGSDALLSRKAARLGGFFESIPNRQARDHLYALIKAMATTAAYSFPQLSDREIPPNQPPHQAEGANSKA